MAIKRISFIEVSQPGMHMLSKFPMPRLGAVLLATILRDRGHEVKTFVQDIAEPDWSYIENSDLVCISTITSTALKSYEIARGLRARGIRVVMGGVHPTFLPDEALDHSDFVVRGEGETTLTELIEHIERGTPSLPEIPGLSYRDKDGKTVHNAPRELFEDLDKLPEPDFSLIHNWSPSNIYTISTSRGCPFSCKFCSVIQMFGRKYRFRSVESTLNSLRYISSVSKGFRFFVDDNFAANKQRTKEILRGMIDEKMTTDWACQVRTDVARDPELLRLMADAGCHTAYIGLESINPETLRDFNKKQDINDIVNCIRTVKDHGIHIHGMFVLGADTDNLDTIAQTGEFAANCGIDTMQAVVLTPLPGTPLFDEMQSSGRLLHSDWSKYDVQHVVFRPKMMSPRALQMETFRQMESFYSWKYIMRRLAKFDFHYVAIGLFGKFMMGRVMKVSSEYLDGLGPIVN